MFDFLAGNGLWRLVHQSDVVSKAVLVLLLGMSVACWTVFIFKIIVLCLKCRQLEQVHRELNTIDSVDALLDLTTRCAGTIAGYYFTRILVFLKTLLASNNNHEGILQDRDWDIMQRYIEQTLEIVVSHEETYVSLLSTSAAVAPLLGLFGTVWGLVHAFMSISELQSADIATVAPGIAEALITTLAGLMVAIPALVMFNIIQRYLRYLERQMCQVADHVALIMQKMVRR